MTELRQVINFTEDNFGLGDHRRWNRKDREAWHSWAERQSGEPHPIEECCAHLPDTDRPAADTDHLPWS
jgi:hypothetical protein